MDQVSHIAGKPGVPGLVDGESKGGRERMNGPTHMSFHRGNEVRHLSIYGNN